MQTHYILLFSSFRHAIQRTKFPIKRWNRPYLRGRYSKPQILISICSNWHADLAVSWVSVSRRFLPIRTWGPKRRSTNGYYHSHQVLSMVHMHRLVQHWKPLALDTVILLAWICTLSLLAATLTCGSLSTRYDLAKASFMLLLFLRCLDSCLSGKQVTEGD